MRQPVNKTATTLRLTPETKSLLSNAAHLLGLSESQVAETALAEFYQNHNLHPRYVLAVTPSHHVVFRHEGPKATVVEVATRNGVPTSDVQKQFAVKLQSPVYLDDEGEGS